MLDLAEPELHVRVTPFSGALASLREHLRRHVHADHSPRWTDPAGGQKAIQPRSAAQVQDDLSRLQRGYRHGVAAAQPQVGLLRYSGQVFSPVAELLPYRHDVDRRRAAAA